MLNDDLLPSETATLLMRTIAEVVGEVIANPARTSERLQQLAAASDKARADIADGERVIRESQNC